MNDEAISWKDSYRIGNESIDAQHRELIELVASLATDGDVYEDDKLAKVLDYAIYHFSEEEALQEEVGYPGYDAHCAEHARLIESLSSLRDQYWARAIPPVEFRRFMFEWVLGHILRDDMNLGTFLANRENAA